MEKFNKKWLALGVLVIMLAISGIAFAAYSATLTIKGSAAYEQDDALVRWKSGSISKSKTGGGDFDGNVATSISSDQLTIASYKALFNSPGSITLQATIENVGVKPAKVTAFNTPTLSCTAGGTADGTFALALCNQLSYVFEYADGTSIQLNDVLDDADEINVRVVITLSAVPTVGTPGEVAITIGDQTITYGDV